jgi:sortase A
MSTLDVKSPAQPPYRSGTARVVRVIGIIGRIFVGAGLLLLFYTAYLLWGTSVYTTGEQNKAKVSLADNPLVAEQDIVRGKIPPARPAQPVTPGSPLWELRIPKLGIQTAVVEGVGKEELKKGPGHFPSCGQIGQRSDCVQEAVYPGERGNVAISGHRTTYGSPFFNIHQLQPGDVIDVFSGPRVRYRYKVREQKIVDPVRGFIEVEQHGRDELTLTTCHPRFSASQRLIINADYIGASVVASAGNAGGSTASGTNAVVAPDVLILAGIAIASALASLALSKRHKAWALYITLGMAGAAGLWVGVFPRVLALLPANY